MMRHVLALTIFSSMLLALATALPPYASRGEEDPYSQLRRTLDAIPKRPYSGRAALGDLVPIPSGGLLRNWDKRSLGESARAKAFDYDNFENQMSDDALQSKILRKRDWKSFRGAWGKRDPGWNNLTGLWGKRNGDDSWGVMNLP